MQHLAMIMDGNRRWAKKNSIVNPYNEKSQEAVKTAIAFCIKNNIKFLSLFAFSLENFKRSTLEQDRVFSLLESVLTKHSDDLVKEGVRIRFIGDRSAFPARTMPAILHAEEKSAHCDRLSLNILFCYGAQQELIAVMQHLADKVKQGLLAIDQISDETIRSSLWTAGIPDPELIIRTSGVSRLSNFLLYQAAYSELAFLDCFWPEITEAHLERCVSSYQEAKRNFGN